MKTPFTSSPIFCGVALSAAILCAAAAVQADPIYTFNNLQPGLLVGQDNWTQWQPLESTTFNQTVSYGTGSNTTLVAGTPVGEGSSQAGIVARVNDSNYAFSSYTGTETDATLEFDFQYQPNDSYQGGARFGLAADIDGNNTIENTTEWGPMFGVSRSNKNAFGPLKFYLRLTGAGTQMYSGFTVAEQVEENAVAGDWLRLRLVIDFTANFGDGSGTLYWKNLTLGNDWTLVEDMVDVDLELSSGPAPSTWNTMITRIDSRDMGPNPSELDANVVAYDNLNPNVNAVIPEPSTLALLASGLLGLLCYAWKKRR